MNVNSTLRKVTVSEYPGDKRIGFFHTWGTASHPLDNGLDLQVTVAIIEFPDGKVQNIVPNYIRFEV